MVESVLTRREQRRAKKQDQLERRRGLLPEGENGNGYHSSDLTNRILGAIKASLVKDSPYSQRGVKVRSLQSQLGGDVDAGEITQILDRIAEFGIVKRQERGTYETQQGPEEYAMLEIMLLGTGEKRNGNFTPRYIAQNLRIREADAQAYLDLLEGFF